MRVKTATIISQIYILPYIKVTHNRWLNGDLELIVGWINKELIISV